VFYETATVAGRFIKRLLGRQVEGLDKTSGELNNTRKTEIESRNWGGSSKNDNKALGNIAAAGKVSGLGAKVLKGCT